MIYGKDGTGKTGAALTYLTPEDIAEGYKMLIIDLDGGNLPLIETYYPDTRASYIVRNPEVTTWEDNEVVIDYRQTMARIRAIARWLTKNYADKKIKAVCLDGVSTLLRIAEYQMRVEKNIDADGGVSTRYWIRRNKSFLEILQLLKGIPIDKFFIAHEDFILPLDAKEKVSAVKSKTNQLMFQKVHCTRKQTADDVIYTATVDKNKFNVSTEGKAVDFLKVRREDGKWKFRGTEVLNMLTEEISNKGDSNENKDQGK